MHKLILRLLPHSESSKYLSQYYLLQQIKAVVKKACLLKFSCNFLQDKLGMNLEGVKLHSWPFWISTPVTKKTFHWMNSLHGRRTMKVIKKNFLMRFVYRFQFMSRQWSNTVAQETHNSVWPWNFKMKAPHHYNYHILARQCDNLPWVGFHLRSSHPDLHVTACRGISFA